MCYDLLIEMLMFMSWFPSSMVIYVRLSMKHYYGMFIDIINILKTGKSYQSYREIHLHLRVMIDSQVLLMPMVTLPFHLQHVSMAQRV